MNIAFQTAAVYLVVGLLLTAFGCFCVALVHLNRIRTEGKTALIKSMSWSGSGFMLFSSCGLLAEMAAFGHISLGYNLVITSLMVFGLWMFIKSKQLSAK